jgi:hypothetical protein
MEALDALPGGDLVAQGVADLREGRDWVPALLASMGAPRLRRLGLDVPSAAVPDAEHALYRTLVDAHRDAAHSRYNAPVRRLVSFERAGMRTLVDAGRIRELMRAMGRAARRPARVYLTGGATAVLHGWRPSTIDVDLKLVPDDDALLRARAGTPGAPLLRRKVRCRSITSTWWRRPWPRSSADTGRTSRTCGRCCSAGS